AVARALPAELPEPLAPAVVASDHHHRPLGLRAEDALRRNPGQRIERDRVFRMLLGQREEPACELARLGADERGLDPLIIRRGLRIRLARCLDAGLEFRDECLVPMPERLLARPEPGKDRHSDQDASHETTSCPAAESAGAVPNCLTTVIPRAREGNRAIRAEIWSRPGRRRSGVNGPGERAEGERAGERATRFPAEPGRLGIWVTPFKRPRSS